MKKVYILKGLPASGKSTWAKDLISKNPGVYKRINKDDLRAMLDNSHHSKGNEKFILNTRDWLIVESLKSGKSVIVDDTNLAEFHEIRIKEIVDNFVKETNQQIKLEVKFFDLPLEDCIKRDLNRFSSVGEKVIRNMYNTFIKKESKNPVYSKQDESLKKAIICDLDGTIALMNNRNPYDGAKCETDLLNEPVANLVNHYKQIGYDIILLSGRDGKFKPETINWLNKYNIDYDALFMRAENDQRKDSVIKIELFEQNIKDKWFIEFVLDDRNQVVDMWRKELGLACFQVYYGDF